MSDISSTNSLFTKSTFLGVPNGHNPYPNLDFLQQETTAPTSFEINDLINEPHPFISDLEEVKSQNKSPGIELKALNTLVIDLWNAFRRYSSYQPTQLNRVPVAKWGQGTSATNGPYTYARPYPNESSNWQQIISLPGRYKEKGIVGWSCLAHEVSHDLLEGNGSKGLISGLKKALIDQLPQSSPIEQILKEYFINRISETAADVLGVLLLGPAAGIGLIAYLRSHQNLLSCSDIDPSSTHPVAISRAYLVAYTVNQLFSTSPTNQNLAETPIQNWNKDCHWMMDEVIKDLSRNGPNVQVGSVSIPINTVSSYAENVVNILVQEIRKVLSKTWDDTDNAKVDVHLAKGLGANSGGDSRHKIAATFFASLSFVPKDPYAGKFGPGTLTRIDPNQSQSQIKQYVSNLFHGMIKGLS